MRPRCLTLTFALVIATAAAAAPRARADQAATTAARPAAFSIGSRPAWFVLLGVTTGGTVALADRGAFVGGELSLVRLREQRHVGVYADAYYDWGLDGLYGSAGLELGQGVVGVDGGVALRAADGERDLGATGRLCATVGLASLCLRYAYFGDAGPGATTEAMADEHVLQVGVLLKFPVLSPWGGDQ